MSVSADLIPVEIDVLYALVDTQTRYLSEVDLAVDLGLTLPVVRSAMDTLRLRALVTPDRRGLAREGTRWSATTLGDAVAEDLRSRR